MAKQAHRKLGIDWSDPEAVRAYHAEYQRTRQKNDPAWAEKKRRYQRDWDQAHAAIDPDFWKKQNKHIKSWKDRLRIEHPERYKEMVRKGQSPESKKRYTAEKLKQDPTYFKRHRLWRDYRMTLEEYDAKIVEQNNLCAICRRQPVETNKITKKLISLAVDHDHSCCPGKRSCGACVRGLLCFRCNNALLGSCDDQIEILESAIRYLKRYKREFDSNDGQPE